MIRILFAALILTMNSTLYAEFVGQTNGQTKNDDKLFSTPTMTSDPFCAEIANKAGKLGPVGDALVKKMGQEQYSHYYLQNLPPFANCPKFFDPKANPKKAESLKKSVWAYFFSSLAFTEQLRMFGASCNADPQPLPGAAPAAYAHTPAGYWLLEKSQAVRKANNRGAECVAAAKLDGSPEGLKAQEYCELSLFMKVGPQYYSTIERRDPILIEAMSHIPGCN